MKRKCFVQKLAVMLTTLFLIITVTACGKPKEVAEKRVIVVANVGDFTGPVASTTQSMLQGWLDYWAKINEEGGINGIPVKAVWGDGKGEVPTGVSAYKSIVARYKPATMVVTGSGICDALKDDFIRDKIPSLGVSNTPYGIQPPAWTYNNVPCYADGLAGFALWAKKVVKKTPVRVCVAPFDYAAGREFLPAIDWIKKNVPEVKIVGPVWLPLMAVDLTSEATRIKKLKPDYVFIPHTVGGTALLYKSLKGVKFPINKCVAFWWAAGGNLLERAGAVAEGSLAQQPWAMPEEVEIPAIKACVDWHEHLRFTRIIKGGVNYTQAWAAAMIHHEAIKRTLDAVGYSELTGENVKKHGFNTLKDFDMKGIQGNVTFGEGTGPETMRGNSNVFMYQVKGGKYVRIAEIPCPLVPVKK